MKCPKCLDEAYKTKWKPVAGFDSRLVQYQCSHCRYVFYERKGKYVNIQSTKQTSVNR